MKKQLLILTLLAVAAGCAFEAQGWRGRRGYYGRGYGRGYGWGPAVGVGFTVPLGGGSSGPRRPSAVKQFKKIHEDYPANAGEFCKWAHNYFTREKADNECKRYENYINAPRSYSRPRGYMSFGVGGGGYGRGYGGPWW
jgi:hypothetical protein